MTAWTGKGAAMGEVDLSFVERYVALWNEPDVKSRRRAIEDLWAPEGTNYTASIEAVGYDEIDARVTSSFLKYIGPGKYHFRTHLPPAGHHGMVKVTWEMVTLPEEEIASIGVEILALDQQGRIISDHQFILS